MNKYERAKAKMQKLKYLEKLQNFDYIYSKINNLPKIKKINLRENNKKIRILKKFSHNFKNNQNYIKSKNFDKYFFRAKILYYFLKNFLLSFIVFAVILLIFILLFKSNLFIHCGLVYNDDIFLKDSIIKLYYYFNKKFVFFYFFILIGTLFLLFRKNKILKEFSGDKIYHNLGKTQKLNLFKNWRNKVFLIIAIIFCIAIGLYFSGFFFAINIFLFGFFILIFHFIFDIKKFSKEKTYIKKPIINYFNILVSIEKNNIIIREFKQNKNNFFAKFFSILYIIFLSIFIWILFIGVSGSGFYENLSYSFMSINLDKIEEKDLLNLKNKNLGDESTQNIFEYLDNKNIKKLDISGNNYTSFIHGKNKIDFINYGKLENYYKNSNLENLILEYKKVKKYYNEIVFNFELWKALGDSELNILDFSDKYKIFKKYYEIDKNGIKKLEINFDNNNINYFSKNNIDIRKRIENGKFLTTTDIINKILEKSKNNFLFLLNNKEIFEKGFKINIKNAFLYLKGKELKEKIEFFKKIDNPKLDLSFFDFDNFCNINKQKFDCNILKNRFKSISNNNKKEILLNNNYIFSNYGKINKDYKNIQNQAVLFDIYFKLKNRKTKIEKLVLANNYIDNAFFQNLVLDFKNIKTINLANIESEKPFIIDSDKTSIENFILTSGTKFKIIRKNDKKNLNILIDDYKINGYSDPPDITFPDIFIGKNKEIYNIGAGKNNLYKYPNIYLGHYKFSDDFVNGLYRQNSNIFNILDYIYGNYYENIFSKKELTEEDLEKFWLKYKSNDEFKKQIDLFIKVNKKNVEGFYTGLAYSFKNLGNNEKEKIQNLLKYLVKNQKFKKFLKDFKIYELFKDKYNNSFGLNNIFNEVFKVGNIYIFVKK